MSKYPSSGISGSSEWRDATIAALAIVTILITIALCGSFVNYNQVVASGHPWLPRLHCFGCPLCGMTRSFCAMSAGHWQQAMTWNSAGPALYWAFWVWVLGAGWLFIAKRFRPRLF